MKRWIRDFEIGIEEIILFIIIVLNILDVFEVIGGDLDYIKKIISWVALGLLMYKVKLSKLFVGRDSKWLDFALIMGYFLLTIKNLVSYAAVELEGATVFLKEFFEFLVSHAASIEIWGIYVGLVILLFVSIHLSFKYISNPSLMHLIHAKESKPKDFKDFLFRLVTVFGVVLSFFLVFFNLIMEWLAIAIDAPLLMIGLATYVFFLVKHKEHFSQKSFLKRFGDYGSSLYESVLKGIQYRKTFFKTISAMIILHMLTDTYAFVWPYIVGFGDRLYSGLLSSAHVSAFELFSSQIRNLPFIEIFSLGLIYLGNCVALLFFLLFPVYSWFVFYKNRTVHPKPLQLSILVSSLVMFFLAPTFKISPLFGEQLFGVDILGQTATSSFSFLSVVIVALAAGLFIELYASHIEHEKWVLLLLLFVSQAFLVIYMGFYLFSISSFYVSTLVFVFFKSMYVLLFFFGLLFLITILFYILGVGQFVLTTFRHFMEHVSLERKRF